MAERELAAAEAFFADVAAERRLERELDERLAGPATPLIAVLEGWEEAPASAAPLLAVNAEHVAALDRIVDADGWPGLRAVGVDGADAAWLLARHADRDNERRRAWLTPLADAVASGDADPRHLATLADRTAVVGGDPQPYGTIVLLASDGELEYPVPVLDHAKLDERRDALGLPPAASEAPYLGDGDLEPYGPDRGSNPVNQWPITLEGHVSVEAALAGGSRRVHRIWATRPGDRRLGRLRALARERGVLIEAVDAATIDEVATGRTHGGVVALVGPQRPRNLADLTREVGEGSVLVMLDGIEDPFNYGQALRALYAAGVDGVVTRRSWETATTTIARASAGASELLPIAVTDSAASAATICRRRGLKVAAAVADPGAVPMVEADLSGGWFILIGGERRGVTRSFVDEADLVFRIDYGRPDAPALGAAVSAALIGFEVLRQRREREA
jgi:23S rRNA (guanosine2251-2'-O)-methyltransferase